VESPYLGKQWILLLVIQKFVLFVVGYYLSVFFDGVEGLEGCVGAAVVADGGEGFYGVFEVV
jgi:hypothetical protein